MRHDNEDEHMSALEAEFESLVKGPHGTLLEEKLKQASKLLDEAVALADEHGIPFQGISFVRNPYIPQKFIDKFQELDSDFVDRLVDVSMYGEYGRYAGWQHSDALC